MVSLKEGMFNHANVVFRTKFVEGVSTVTRTANSDPHGSRQAKNQSCITREQYAKHVGVGLE